MLDWPTLNTRDLLAAINKAASDPDMMANMERASRMFVDSAESPQARAVWWIEYVMRNRGAQFLKPPSLELPWYQYHLLDVLALIATISLTVNFMIIVLCCKCFKCLFPPQKITIRKKKI